MAVANLAEFYYTLSKSADVVKVVSLFEKVISLEGKGGEIYDAKAYKRVLTKFVNDILSKSQELFNHHLFLSVLHFCLRLTRQNANRNSRSICVVNRTSIYYCKRLLKQS